MMTKIESVKCFGTDSVIIPGVLNQRFVLYCLVIDLNIFHILYIFVLTVRWYFSFFVHHLIIFHVDILIIMQNFY